MKDQKSQKSLYEINSEKIKNIHKNNVDESSVTHISLAFTLLVFYFIFNPLSSYGEGLIFEFIHSHQDLDFFLNNSENLSIYFIINIIINLFLLFAISFLDKQLLGDKVNQIHSSLIMQSQEFFLIKLLKSSAILFEILIHSIWKNFRKYIYIFALLMLAYASLGNSYYWVLPRLLVVNFTIFTAFVSLYFLINISKYYYTFSFPVHFISNTSIMEKLVQYHQNLNTDEHVGKHLYNTFSKILNKPIEFSDYVKRADFSSAIRLLWMASIKLVLRIFYSITIHLTKYFKTKYLYYALYPIMKVFHLFGNALIIIPYNIFMAAFAAALSLSNLISILFWTLLSISIAILTLLLNIISYDYIVKNYQSYWDLASLIVIYFGASISLALVQYGALPPFLERYNFLNSLSSFKEHRYLLGSDIQKSFFIISTILSLFVASTLLWDLIVDHILQYDLEFFYDFYKTQYIEQVDNFSIFAEELFDSYS